jgi:hypothetical protein
MTENVTEVLAQPRYHVAVLCEDDDDPRDGYSDPLSYGEAVSAVQGLTAAPQPGMREIYIIEGDARDCPLAHGGDPESDTDMAARFLVDVVKGQEPFWSANP